MSKNKNTEPGWAICAAIQKPGDTGDFFAPTLEGSKVVALEILKNKDEAIAVAGDMTSQDWETQHDDGQMFVAVPIEPGTPFNFAFSQDVKHFDPELHTVGLEDLYPLEPERAENIRKNILNNK